MQPPSSHLHLVNRKWDIFLRDRQESTTARVSVSSTGAQSDGDSWLPHISEDGTIIVYTSSATNLVSSDTNGKWDIFAYNRLNGQTERISVSATGGQADKDSGDNKAPAVSADGRYVAFYSAASNLVAGDTNVCLTIFYNSSPCPDVFVRDRLGGTTERVSVSSTGTQTTIDPIDYFKPPAISGDGRIVVFASSDTTLAAGATNGYTQILAHDRTTLETTLVSASTYRWQGNSWSHCPPDISTTGRYVSFHSLASDLVTDDGNGFADIFVRDREGWTYAMDGTVRNAEGDPMAGVWVGYGTGVGEWKETDTNGEYQLYYMPTGTYAIHAVLPGYTSDPPVNYVTLPPTTIGVDFILRTARVVYLPYLSK